MPKDFKVKTGKGGIRIVRRKPTQAEILALLDSILINATVLKMKLKYLLPLILAAMTLAGYAQTNAVPPTANLADEQLGLTTSGVTDGEQARSAITLDYNATKNFYLRGEVQLGTSADIVENLGVGLGFYKNLSNFRIFAGPIFSYNWEGSKFLASVGVGTAYQPFQDGALAKWSVYSEFRLTTALDNNIRSEPPHRALLAGVRYSF